MTTILLTIIGVLLAAASTLMAIYYGGDAFSSSDLRTRAAMFQNAGLNVVSAVRLYNVTTGGPRPTITDLIDQGYLEREPITPRPQQGDTFSQIRPFYNREFYTTPVASAKVCEQIERNAGRTYPNGWVEPTIPQGKFGCSRLEAGQNLQFYMAT